MNTPVSACLLSWKRPDNLAAIVQSLERLPFVDEILVWNNNREVALALPGTKARVINSPENEGCFGRYLCARQARHSTIYVQDDDVVNHDVDDLYERFCADPTRIVHVLSPWHHARRRRTVYGECQNALVGWGAFFTRDWTRVMDSVPAALRDTWLFRREADTFFTLMLRRHHHAVLKPIRHLPTHSTTGIALWKDPGHAGIRALAVREALHLLRTRRDPAMPIPWNVVIPCHNYARFLTAAVESVFRNAADFTVTIVDDASTDETPEVAAALAARFRGVTFHRNERRRGAGWARNHGIAAVDSNFVVVLDADDRIGDSYLFEAEAVLRRGADVANPDARLFGAKDSHWPVPRRVTIQMLLERNPVHYCAAFRRSYWAQVGGYDEQLPNWEDYEFWIRVAAAGARIHAVPGAHFFYRQHHSSKSRRANQRALREYIFTKHADLFSGSPAGVVL